MYIIMLAILSIEQQLFFLNLVSFFNHKCGGRLRDFLWVCKVLRKFVADYSTPKYLPLMNSNSLVSINDISRDEILDLIERARFFEEHPNHKILDGKVVATLFLNLPHALV